MKKTLIAAVMFLALSAAAFAQTSFTVASTPETFVSCCGLTEKTGDVAFTAVVGTPNTVAGTLTITYPVPITYSAKAYAIWTVGHFGTAVDGTVPAITDFPLSAQPAVAQTTFDADADTTYTIPTVSNIDGKGTVVIPVPAGGIAPFSIRLTGIRVNVSGSCSGSVSASITSTGNLLTSGETSVVVISNVAQALRTPVVTFPMSINAVTGAKTVNTTTVDGATTAIANVAVQENFLDAFGKVPATDTTANTAKVVRLTFTKIPAGVTFSFDAAITTSNGKTFDFLTASGDANRTLKSSETPGSVYYILTTDTDPTLLETLNVPVTVATAGPFPLASDSIKVSAHIGPIDESPLSTTVPRFVDATCETGSTTVVTIAGASTTLLVPYAINTQGYDTGLAVANTTTDPTTAAMGFTQAIRQTGGMTFYFYPQTGTPVTYATTAGSPGTGLSADGTLATGSTYAVLLSQLLAAAGADTEFTGYIFIITNFTNAHGQYFISDFEFFTNGALMLVVNNPNPTFGRTNPEILGN